MRQGPRPLHQGHRPSRMSPGVCMGPTSTAWRRRKPNGARSPRQSIAPITPPATAIPAPSAIQTAGIQRGGGSGRGSR